MYKLEEVTGSYNTDNGKLTIIWGPYQHPARLRYTVRYSYGGVGQGCYDYYSSGGACYSAFPSSVECLTSGSGSFTFDFSDPDAEINVSQYTVFDKVDGTINITSEGFDGADVQCTRNGNCGYCGETFRGGHIHFDQKKYSLLVECDHLGFSYGNESCNGYESVTTKFGTVDYNGTSINVKLIFSKRKERVSVESGDGGTAEVSGGENNGSQYTSADWGNSITIKATPDECHRFVRWEKVGYYDDPHDVNGSTEPEITFEALPAKSCSVETATATVVEYHCVYKAVFEVKKYEVQLVARPEGSASFEHDGEDGSIFSVDCGSNVNIEANPKCCYVFDRWDDGSSSEYNTLTVLGNITKIAYMKKKETIGTYIRYAESSNLPLMKCERPIYGEPGLNAMED